MVGHQHTDSVDHVVVPESVDWRTKGVVTPVRNQGELDSSHSFAAADAISRYEKYLKNKSINFIIVNFNAVTLPSLEGS